MPLCFPGVAPEVPHRQVGHREEVARLPGSPPPPPTPAPAQGSSPTLTPPHLVLPHPAASAPPSALLLPGGAAEGGQRSRNSGALSCCRAPTELPPSSSSPSCGQSKGKQSPPTTVSLPRRVSIGDQAPIGAWCMHTRRLWGGRVAWSLAHHAQAPRDFISRPAHLQNSIGFVCCVAQKKSRNRRESLRTKVTL